MMGTQAGSHTELYLGPAEGPCARTADAIAVLDDGELPVHVSCLRHGALEEAVSLALEKRHYPIDPLKISLPGCTIAHVAPFFQLLYGRRADQIADSMSMDDVLRAGLIADKFNFTATTAVVEQVVLAKCLGKKATWSVDASSFTSAIPESNVETLLGWAEAVGSERVGMLCGFYLGACAVKPKLRDNAKMQAFETAMTAFHHRQQGTPFSVTL